MVIPLDDFQIILGLEFFKAAKVMILPHLNGMLIGAEECTGFVPMLPAMAKESSGPATTAIQETARDSTGAAQEGGRLSAKKLNKGLHEGDQTYVAALIEVESSPHDAEDVPAQVGEVLREFDELIPDELPKELPPRRAHDHRMELEPGARPLARTPYRMGLAELKELHVYLDEFVIIYLDDIVIHSSRWEQHMEHLRRVLQRLREHHLHVKREKCEFARTDVHLLGHIVDHGARDSTKVLAIQDRTTSATVSEFRSFLGLANCYRRLIKGYSTFASPLTDLLMMEQRWSWSSICEETFDLSRLEDPFEVTQRKSDFDWEHRPGRQNQVADAFSRQMTQEIMAAVATTQTDMTERICETAQTDAAYARTMRDVMSNLMRRCWIRDDLLRAQRGRLVVPKNDARRRDLLKESHDSRRARHPGIERINALLSRDYGGPFKVLRRIGEAAYKLALSARLRIHPVFHVSFLKPYHEDLNAEQLENPGRMHPAVRPRLARRIARILADREVGTSQGPQDTEYLVQWHGEDVSDATWWRTKELWQSEDDIRAYTRENATGASAPSSGGGLSPPQ